ncbi:MAG: maleylpyruvate isomerase N-terminal domain-containing protein [Actinobacteria bacterium]|nr:maleylpyruvate isomerase N-terminal domain-containing protein [Actinomycetota bacterium]
MELIQLREAPAPLPDQQTLLAAYDDGVEAICRLAGQFDKASWDARTPCPEWCASEVAGHLRCVADDLHEYLDEAPASRYARLMATGADSELITRKLARQNAAELAALAEAAPADNVASFATSARSYAARLPGVWNMPHHLYRDTLVTVGGMAAAACAEWHLHAFDLAAALGSEYQPADAEVVLAAWLAGMPHLPLLKQHGQLASGRGLPGNPWHAVLAASGRGAAEAGREPGNGQPEARGPARSKKRRKG